MTTYAIDPTPAEVKALNDAILRYCTCGPPHGHGRVHCAAHDIYREDKIVAHMIFMYRMRGRLIVQEFVPTPKGSLTHA